MDENRRQRPFTALSARLGERLRTLGGAERWPPLELRRLFIEEIWSSTALAGSTLDSADVETVARLRTTRAPRPLADYVTVADYADAAAYAWNAPRPGRRSYLRLDEIVELHARALRRTPDAFPGRWRTTTAAPFSSGVVPPPAWLIPRDMAVFTERFAAGPGDRHPVLWAADAYARLTRIHPFAAGNGRVGRLIANLVLRRLGLPPLCLQLRDVRAYVEAVQRGQAGDPWPLAIAFAGALLRAADRLLAAREPAQSLRPLTELVSPNVRPALYKAAQRGRLRAVRRAGTLYTTPDWVAEYRASLKTPPS